MHNKLLNYVQILISCVYSTINQLYILSTLTIMFFKKMGECARNHDRPCATNYISHTLHVNKQFVIIVTTFGTNFGICVHVSKHA